MDTAHYVILHDGTMEGMLHGVAAAIKSGKKVIGIYPEGDYLAQLFISEIRIDTDFQQAAKLFKYLQEVGGEAARYALNGYLSEDRNVGTHLVLMIKELLRRGGGFTQCYTHDSVRYLAQLSQKVAREAHRFTGLIRFRILDDGLQYAPFESDCNIIGYCAHHFQQRLKNTHWILHDLRRGQAVFWDCETLQDVQIDKSLIDSLQQNGEIPESMLSSSEVYYQDLWKAFHQSISNKNRENLQLQRQRMPQRYWKYLIETP